MSRKMNMRKKTLRSLAQCLSVAALLTAATVCVRAADTEMTNLSDGTTTENVSVDGTLTLLNTADSSYGGTETPFKTITATGLNVQAGAFTQTVTGELYVGASGATISSGTLHILGAGTTLDAATSAGTSVTIADGARLLFENAVPRNDTGAVKITIQQGGTLEFTNMSSESHTADNALAQLKSDSYPGSVSTKTLTLTGDGTLVKSGTGSLFTVCTGASKIRCSRFPKTP